MSDTEASCYTVDDDFTFNVIEDDETGLLKMEKFDEVTIIEKTETIEEDARNSQKPTAVSLGKGLLKCHLCGYVSATLKNLNAHVKIHSDPSKPDLYKCKSCCFETFSKSNLTCHMGRCAFTTRKFSCPHCKFGSIKYRNLRVHLLNVHSFDGNFFNCKVCPFKSSEFSTFTRHNDENHQVRKKCEHCDFTVSSQKMLKKHMKIHEGVVKYKCADCEFEATNKKVLRLHARKHVMKQFTRVRIFKCDLCDYESRYRTNVARHRTTHIARISNKLLTSQ